MIVDSLTNSETYNPLHPLFGRAFSHIRSVDFNTLPHGRYDISDGIYYMWGENDLKHPENAPLEVHNKYIDIQIIVCGKESFGHSNRGECLVPHAEFNSAKDIMFFDDAPSTYVTLKDGEFVIFMPQDAHAPLIGVGKVSKCIIKVPVTTL